MTEHRREIAFRTRKGAAEAARRRTHPQHLANGDEQRWATANYAMSFTKGLDHNDTTGLAANPDHVAAFRRAIDDGAIDAFSVDVPVPPHPDPTNMDVKRRQWEAPTAGIVYDLQGPDAQAVTMPPAPELGSRELAYELAEVYELATLRDVPLTAFSKSGSSGAERTKVSGAVQRLNDMPYNPKKGGGRPRKSNAAGKVNRQRVFRGSSPGVAVGPYLSQFMLIGTKDQPEIDDVTDGRIQYGSLRIDQRVPVAPAGVDYMETWEEWLVVQKGGAVQDDEALYPEPPAGVPARRFISTPRDLATYVHYDALYEAYLNACLILLAMKTPFDPSFDKFTGPQPYDGGSSVPARHATGFALFGGPHILTLVTEVATRALKAVRYQKYNVHLRLRPEALGARMVRVSEIEMAHPPLAGKFSRMAEQLEATFNAVRNRNNPTPIDPSTAPVLLPMAFQEGSPMHPAYGAGHATVAGACVTVLKAFFDTTTVFASRGSSQGAFVRYKSGDGPVAYTPNEEGEGGHLGGHLVNRADAEHPFLTLEGELNKLAANISIGRNMAGVHYFSDYYDSLRMGEEIALGMLEEQALCYPNDPFVLTVPTFDGDVVRIGAR